MKTQSYPKGKLIYDIGVCANDFYIIKSGHVKEEISFDLKKVRKIPTGDHKWELMKQTTRILHNLKLMTE